jgi:hypothetical protein
MDNIYFKQLFRKFSGYVYQYSGQIPDGEDAKPYIVDEFVSLAGKVGLELSLTQLSNNLYVIHSYENIENENFNQLCDLSFNPPAPEPEPEPEPEGEE